MTSTPCNDVDVDVVDERSNRLARALRRRLHDGDVIVIAVCDPVERAVAKEAAEKAALRSHLVSCSADAATFSSFLAAIGATSAIACEHGVERWRGARRRGVVFANTEDVVWWRAAELRESADPLWIDTASSNKMNRKEH